MTAQAITKMESTLRSAVIRERGPAWAVVTFSLGAVVAVVLASAIVLALAAAIASCHALAETAAVRRRWARYRQRRQRRTRRVQRAHRLDEVGAHTDELSALSSIVESIARHDTVGGVEIEPLLDRYADLAVARQRCVVTLARANRPSLEAKLAAARTAGLRGAEMLERRVSHVRTVVQMAHDLDDALTEVAEAIHYFGERATVAGVSWPLSESDPITTVLAYYDACDAVDDRQL